MSQSLIYYKRELENTVNESLIVGADGDSLFNDLVLSDTNNNLVLQVTAEQYCKLLSAALNGCYRTYPENPLGVLYPLIKAGKLEFCAQVINCIQNDEDTRNALLSLLNGTTFSESVNNGQSQNGVDIANSDTYNPTCDLDILYGQTRQLVDYLDAINTDILEILEVATNLLDFAASVVGDVTLIDETSIDAILSWVSYMQDNIAENYAAQVTQTYLEECACDIFCLAKDNGCEITPNLLFNYWNDRLSGSLSIGGLLVNSLVYLVGGTWIGTEIADFMFLSQLALRSQAGQVLDFSAYFDIQTRLEIYSNDPNSDWSTLCNCPTVLNETVTYDGTGWTDYTVPEGSIDATFGDPAPSGKSARNAAITTERNVTVVTFNGNFVTISGIHFWGWATNPSGTWTALVQLRDQSDTVIASQQWIRSANETWIEQQWTGGQVTGVWSIRFIVGKYSPNAGDGFELYQDNLNINFEYE